MILSDRENKLILHRARGGITPTPPDTAFSSTGIDLTLHELLSVWLPHAEEKADPVVVYPGQPESDVEGLLHVCLQPGMKICQLILEEVHGTPDKGYQGAFAIQAPEAPAAPTPSPAPQGSSHSSEK